MSFSADGERILLKKTNETSCALVIENTTSEDNGRWLFTMEAGQAENGIMTEYAHNVFVKIKGYSHILRILVSILINCKDLRKGKLMMNVKKIMYF